MILKFKNFFLYEKLNIDVDEVIKWGDNNGWSVFSIESETDTNEEYYDALKEEITIFIKSIKDKYDDTTIPIYRVISLDSINDLNDNKLGVCWSMDKNGYKYYMKSLDSYYPNKMYLIESEVSTNNIDWNITIFQNLLSSGESEIRVKDEHLLQIKKIEKIK